MKILVADDSPVIRTAVSVILNEAGFEVVTAEDGIDTIQKFYAERPDLLVLDIQMPKMTGYMAARLLKEDWSVAHVPILILTAHDSAEDRYWADKSGADGYLTKETLGDDLIPAIRSASVSKALSELSGSQADESVDLDQVDVLARVTAMLDRKLFEMTIVNDIVTMATRAMDLRATLTELMIILRRFVTFDVVAISLSEEKITAVRLDRTVSETDYGAFVQQSSMELVQRASVDYGFGDMTVWRCDSLELAESASLDRGWASMFAMELRIRGELLGTLAVGSARPNAFNPQTARTLRTVEYPLATVIDSAIHYQRSIENEAKRSLSSLYGDK